MYSSFQNICDQARRQDSVTAGAEINFGGAREVDFCEIERGTGAREIYSSVDQTNKVKTKKKGLQFKNFHEFWLSSQTSCDFSSENQKKKKKKGLCPKSFMKSGVSPQKLRKYGR